MRRHGLTGLFLCLFAIWVQTLAPVAAVALVQAGSLADPIADAVICTHDSGSNDAGSHDAPAPGHHHCLLCQVCAGGGLLPAQPAFTAIDYPAASPLRWRRATPVGKSELGQRPGQPRGPPAFA